MKIFIKLFAFLNPGNRKFFSLIFVLLSFSLTSLNLLLPHCIISRTFEQFLFGLSILLMFGWFVGLSFFYPEIFRSINSEEKEKHENILYVGVLFLCYTPTFFSSFNRYGEAMWQYVEFKGTISHKFLSPQFHEAKSLTIDGIEYRRIPAHIWDNVHIGGKIEKELCESSVTNNGIKISYTSNEKTL